MRGACNMRGGPLPSRHAMRARSCAPPAPRQVLPEAHGAAVAVGLEARQLGEALQAGHDVGPNLQAPRPGGDAVRAGAGACWRVCLGRFSARPPP